MWRFFQKVMAPPTFPNDEEKTRVAKFLNTLLMVLFILPAIAVIVFILIPDNIRTLGPIILLLTASLFGVMATLRRGYVQASSIVLTVALLLTSSVLIYNAAGETRPFLSLFASVVIVAGLLLGGWGAMLSTLALITVDGIVSYLASRGIIQTISAEPTHFSAWVVTSGGFIITGLLLSLASKSLNDALSQARANQKKLLISNNELQEAQNSLEQRVEQRTAELQERGGELEELSQRLERRASELQAVALVGKEITSIFSIEELLPRVAQVTAKQFGFYHVGIFIIDRANNIAVLQATNSAGGQKMLSRNHRLKIGEVGIVGYVAEVGRPRVALNTGSDAVFFDNPDLPDTRSEMAIPLKIGAETIGVLDVQSEKEAAFREDDTEILTIVADQISIAIQNARLFDESQQSAANARAVSRQYVREDWQSRSEDETIGYRFSQAGLIQPILHTAETLAAGQMVVPEQPTKNDMLIPIKLHDETIGTLKLQSKIDRTWDQDTIDIAEAVAGRVALAVENSRLLERSQFQAARERTVSEITAKIGASVNMRNVLQTAVEELGRVLPGSDVVIQMESKK